MDNKYEKELHPPFDNRYENDVPDLRCFVSDGSEIGNTDKGCGEHETSQNLPSKGTISGGHCVLPEKIEV